MADFVVVAVVDVMGNDRTLAIPAAQARIWRDFVMLLLAEISVLSTDYEVSRMLLQMDDEEVFLD